MYAVAMHMHHRHGVARAQARGAPPSSALQWVERLEKKMFIHPHRCPTGTTTT